MKNPMYFTLALDLFLGLALLLAPSSFVFYVLYPLFTVAFITTAYGVIAKIPIPRRPKPSWWPYYDVGTDVLFVLIAVYTGYSYLAVVYFFAAALKPYLNYVEPS